MIETLNTIKIILIVALIIFLVVLFVAFKPLRWFVGTCLVIVFIAFSAYAGFSVNNYYSAEGGIIGTLDNLIKGNQLNAETLNFKIDNVVLKATENENEYSLTITQEFNDGIDLTNSYCLFVNNFPCKMSDYSSEFIKGSYYYEFYDNDLELILADTLDISLVFYKTKVKLVVTTTGGERAVGLWNSYFNNNSFVISVKSLNGTIEKTDKELGEFFTHFSKVEFYNGESILMEYYIKNGTTMSYFPNYIIPSGYDFNGWVDINDNIYLPNKEYVVTEYLRLEPSLTAKTCIASYYKDYECTELLGTFEYKTGDEMTKDASIFIPSNMSDYVFNLVLDDENINNVLYIPTTKKNYILGNCSFYLGKKIGGLL